MAFMIALLIIALIFLILSIFLFNGKGKRLIAGYNTLSEKSKKQYVDKKLCKTFGILCLTCSIMLCVMACFGHQVDLGVIEENDMLIFAMIFIVVIIGAVVFVNIYINKYAKK